MIKRFPSRNSRSKGIKVKHVLQICLLLGVCFWLIYQVKHSHDKKKEFDEKDAEVTTTRMRGDDNEILKLGRKDLHPRVDNEGKNEKGVEDEDDETVAEEEIINGGGENKRAEELEQNLEVNKHEEEQREDFSKHEEEERGDDDEKHDVEEEKKAGEETLVESRGAGDDDVDEHDQDKLEGESGEEDLLDEEKDKGGEDDDAKEGEGNNEEEKEVHETLSEDEDHEDGSQTSHEAREEHYKGDDASSAVTRDENISRMDKQNDLQEDEVAYNNRAGNAIEIIQTNSTLQQEQGDIAANNTLQEDEVVNNNRTGISNEIIQTDSTLHQEQGDMVGNYSVGVLSSGEQAIKDEKIISLLSSRNKSTANVTDTVLPYNDHERTSDDLAVSNVETRYSNSTGDSVSVAAAVFDSTSEENASGGSAIGEVSNQGITEAEKVNYNETVSGNAQSSSNSSSNLESGVDQTVVEHESAGEVEGVKSWLSNARTDINRDEKLEESKSQSSHGNEIGIPAGVGQDPIDSSDSSVGQEENAWFGTNKGVSNENVAAE